MIAMAAMFLYWFIINIGLSAEGGQCRSALGLVSRSDFGLRPSMCGEARLRRRPLNFHAAMPPFSAYCMVDPNLPAQDRRRSRKIGRERDGKAELFRTSNGMAEKTSDLHPKMTLGGSTSSMFHTNTAKTSLEYSFPFSESRRRSFSDTNSPESISLSISCTVF